AQTWSRQGPLIVHRAAGVGRSTAAAFVTLCTLNPGAPEALVARHIREASATALPKRRLVQLADELLARGGRMIRAINEMGPPKLASEAEPFALPSTFP